jgi:hypothetical protein
MIRHKLPNKTKSATVAEPKLFHQLNNPYAAGAIMNKKENGGVSGSAPGRFHGSLSPVTGNPHLWIFIFILYMF